MCLIANQKPVRNSRVGSIPTPSAFVPIAQWIEHIPPKNGIQVQFLLGTHLFVDFCAAKKSVL